jgi:hypothetical protein
VLADAVSGIRLSAANNKAGAKWKVTEAFRRNFKDNFMTRPSVSNTLFEVGRML